MGRGRSGKGIASVIAERVRKEKALRKRARRPGYPRILPLLCEIPGAACPLAPVAKRALGPVSALWPEAA
jgi:hypothetical protein